MLRKIVTILCAGFILINCCGCLALIFGAAIGIGTAVWLEGKISQEVRADMDQCVIAAERAMDSLKYEITKKTVKADVAQIMGNYPDNRIIWIDIHRIDAKTSKLEVRVGATGEKEPEREIFNRIMHYLRQSR